MRNLLKKLAIATAVLAIMGPVFVGAYNLNGLFVEPFKATGVSNVITAADTEPAIAIKFFPGANAGGTAASKVATVAFEADGNLTFVVNSAAYAGFECPVSGALGGVIDVSDAACNTFGEVVDVINSTAPNFATGYFRAVLLAALRSDSSDASLLADAADTDVARDIGEVGFWDSSNLDDNNVLLLNGWLTDGAKPFISGNKLIPNPFKDTDTVLLYAAETITNAGTIGNFEAYCVVENYKDGGNSTETVRTMYSEAGAATTATGKIDEFINAGGLLCNGGKVIVRILASGADTSAVSLLATGYSRPEKQGQ